MAALPSETYFNERPLSHHMGRPEGFEEDGLFWMGTRQELEAWKLYKQRKAVAFVERGYSVEWYPDGDGWMAIYVPARHHAKAPEIRADVKIFGKASNYGIHGGMISKLSIIQSHSDPLRKVIDPSSIEARVLFNYDRGLEVDLLHASPIAQSLYAALLEELN